MGGGTLPPMEAFLYRLLNMRSDFPIWLRYVLTLGLVGIAFFARLLLNEYLLSYPLLLFIPVIFLSSILFNRGSGILATVASTLLAARYLVPAPAVSTLVPLIVFAIIGLCIAAVTELLRTAVRSLALIGSDNMSDSFWTSTFHTNEVAHVVAPSFPQRARRQMTDRFETLISVERVHALLSTMHCDQLARKLAQATLRDAKLPMQIVRRLLDLVATTATLMSPADRATVLNSMRDVADILERDLLKNATRASL